MTKNLYKVTILLIPLLLLVSLISWAQQPAIVRKYIVVNFSVKYKRSSHGTQYYYWIMPQDSINALTNLHLYPLFLDNFSKRKLIDCCDGKSMNPNIVTSGVEQNFNVRYYKELDELKLLIIKNKRILQKIRKEWPSGQKAWVEVSATSIEGQFCSCKYLSFINQDYIYKGDIFLPLGAFASLEDFWKTAKGQIIKNQDFSIFKSDFFPD